MLDEKQGIIVIARPNEDIDLLIRRFKRKVNKSGILRDVKLKAFYEKPSILKRRKRNEAAVRKLKDDELKSKIKPNRRNNDDR